MSEFSCEPLKPTELRTLHLDESFNACDHTDYGPHNGNENPTFDVLKLFKTAAPSVVRIEERVEDPNKPGSKPEPIGLGSGFIVNSPDGNKVIVAAYHNEEGTPGMKSSYGAIDSRGREYELVQNDLEHLIRNLQWVIRQLWILPNQIKYLNCQPSK